MRNRTLVVGLVLFAALAVGAFATLNSVAVVERQEEVAKEQYQNALKQHEETVGMVEKLADTASTLEEWRDVLARTGALPLQAKEYFTARVHIGMLETLATERDRLFVNAGELFAANEKDPDIRKILDKAREVHKLAETFIQKLSSDSDDPTWRLALQYRKAYEKYRSLAFLAGNEHDEALDIIADVMSNLRLANKVESKNNRVELFMEFVYKKAKEEESKRGKEGASGRPRALPSRGGPHEPGTGGSDRPRRH